MTVGRPREFDTDEALDRALRLFWQKGYGGTSLSDLTAAMGITRPSLYAAFGNKEALFRKALDRYDHGPVAFFSDIIENAPTGRAVAEGMLRGAANFHGDIRNPPGCLMVHGALVGDDESEPLRRETRRRRDRLRERIGVRLERAEAEGDLPPGSDPAGLALYIVGVLRGMAVEAASGATGKDLHRMVDIALRAWPKDGKRATGKKGRAGINSLTA